MGLSARQLLALVAAAGLAAPLGRADMGMDMDGEPAMTPEDTVDNSTTGGSFARCSIVISTSVKEEIALAAEEVANTTAAFVCSQADLGNMTLDDAALATAENVSIIAARAVARLSVDCFVQGMGTVRLNGMGIAEFEATSLAEQLSSVITEVRVCEDCNETASAVGGNFTELFVPAAANATIALMLATTEENQVIAVEEFVESVSEIFVINFTQVLISSRTGAAEEGCDAPDMEPDMEPDMPDMPPNMTDMPPNMTDMPPNMTDMSPNMTDMPPNMTDMPPNMTEMPPGMGGDDPEPEPMLMAGDRLEVECDVSEPVEDFGKCAGRDIDVPRSCASPDFFCVTRGPFFAACRLDGIPLNEDWEGIVFECV